VALTDLETNRSTQRPFSDALDRLRDVGLRPTRQRLALARLLLDGGDRHVTAEAVHVEAVAAGIRVSLATVYNNLHQFTRAGLLREVVVDPGATYFDTNTSDHHHLYYESDGSLVDLEEQEFSLTKMPPMPLDEQVKRVDVVVRIAKIGKSSAK